MGAGPYLNKSVQDAAKRYDRHLAIMWDAKRERFMLVRYNPERAGAYSEIHLFQGRLGEFVMPNETMVMEWLRAGDITRTPGATWHDKIRNFINRQNRHNRDIKEKMRSRGREQHTALLGEYKRVARNYDGNFEETVKHMSERREVVTGEGIQ